MNRASPQMRRFANRLIEYEATGAKSVEATSATFRAADKLHHHLVALTGNNGFRALSSRALALASLEVSRLSAVHVRADGTLAGLGALHAQLEPAEFRDCEVVLIAHLLELLVAFIGANLAASIVKEAWPQISLTDMNFGNGDIK